MAEHSEDRRPRPARSVPADVAPGRYVYCVAAGHPEACPEAIGLKGRRIYAVGCRDICALVHDCPAEPYQSEDPEVVAAWVLAHHRVVEAAWRRWGVVLPLAFNTIIRAGEPDAVRHLRTWLHAEYGSLRARLTALAGKAEYDLQLFWDPALIAKQVAAASAEIGRLESENRARPRGLAYMYRQQLALVLRRELQARAAAHFREVYARVSRCAERVHLGSTRTGEGERPLLMHLSCLVASERYAELEAELDEVAQTCGLAVRLTGPLPPYSFCS